MKVSNSPYYSLSQVNHTALNISRPCTQWKKLNFLTTVPPLFFSMALRQIANSIKHAF